MEAPDRFISCGIFCIFFEDTVSSSIHIPFWMIVKTAYPACSLICLHQSTKVTRHKEILAKLLQAWLDCFTLLNLGAAAEVWLSECFLFIA